MWIFYVLFCLVFAMSLCVSGYMCLVVTCWERADLLALVCGVYLWVCHFSIGILGRMWYLIVSILDLCNSTFFHPTNGLPAIRHLNDQSLVVCWWTGFVLWRHYGSRVIKRKQYFVSKYGLSVYI